MATESYNQQVETFTTYLHRTGFRQKPFVAPMELAYTRTGCVTVEKHDSRSTLFRPKPALGAASIAIAVGTTYVRNAVMRPISETALASLAYSRAYNKLLSKTGERAALLTALAERQSTYTMVLNRLNQLWRGAKALRRGRFREFLATFGIKPKEKHKRTRWARPRDFSSLWLEYWFGWAPTIGDVSNAIDVWQRPIESKVKLRTGSGNRQINESSSRATSASLSTNEVTGKYYLQLRCNVEVTNPDLWVANQMGFLNPVRTAWELTPFSWFVDWFTNVGQVLGSFTDTIGVAVSDVWMTRFFTGRTHTASTRRSDPTDYGFAFQQVVFVNREKLSKLPRPSFILRIPNLSWTRGLTLSSLLVQLFSPTSPSKAR